VDCTESVPIEVGEPFNLLKQLQPVSLSLSWWDSSTSAATRLVRSPSLFLIPFCVAYLVYFGWFVTRLGRLINRDLQLVGRLKKLGRVGKDRPTGII